MSSYFLMAKPVEIQKMKRKECHFCEIPGCLLCSGRDLARAESSNIRGRAALAH